MSMVDDFAKAVENLTQNDKNGLNCFALFLIEQIFCEIQSKAQSPDNVRIPLIEHPLPADNRYFRFFLLLSRHRHELVEYHDVDFHAAWIEEGENFKFCCDSRIQHFKEKHAYFTNWIVALSAQFVSQLEKISKTNRVPLPSLAGIMSAMIFPSELRIRKIIYKHGPELINDASKRISNISTSRCDPICIPADILVKDRDQFIMELSSKIYELLMEIFIALMIEGRAEARAIHAFIKDEQDVPALKNFMLDRTCCEGMERRLSQIGSRKEIEQYFIAEYSILEIISPALESLIEASAAGAAEKNVYRLNIDNYPTMESDDNMWDEDVIAAVPSLVKPGFDDPGIPKKKELPDYAELDFISDICAEARRKLVKKPLRTYKLKSDSESVLKYISTIVYNCSNAIIERQGLPAPGWHTSPRQVRRDNKQLKDGKLMEFIEQYVENSADIESIYDLSEEERDMFENFKVQQMTHQRPGYLTQNELIEALRDPLKIAELKNTGIDITSRANKGFSELTLKRKLKELRNTGKIPYEPSKKAFYFKEEDFYAIAQALADLISD